MGNIIDHYRTRLLCRVPQTLGKGRKTLGEAHTTFHLPAKPTLPSPFSQALGKLLPCAKPHSAKKVETGRANGTNGTGERDERDGRTGRGMATLPSVRRVDRGRRLCQVECCQVGTRRSLDLCRVPRVRHSAKFQTSPSVKVIALGKSFFQKIEKWLLCRVSR